ncbi:hypothetical protein [Devosia salina]|uniref:Uncharacterized protein n=1 Tax=Devosia salina TaxID=2860336 RepID=A0ABX8WEN9_9HYPH|nr:hypothetical protein [Devosia salina]QYO76534.1 hypothetical protein K1X15_18395 [Devosia salina]
MLTPLPLQLEVITFDIRQAINAKLYYPALLVTLTLPEICAGLTLDKSQFVKQKQYVEFVDSYTRPEELGLDGISCYQLRGGLVHRADLRAHPYFGGTHVIFTTPESRGSTHGFSIAVADKSAAMFDLVMMSNAMIEGARRWYGDNSSNQKVAENLAFLIRSCPNGLPPFVAGFPVVASGV